MEFEVDGERVFAAGACVENDPLPAVVLVHGAAMDHSVWSLYTRYFMHVKRSVVAPDLPGHGRSEGAPLPSIEAMASWAGRMLDALGLGAVALAGHSMGALVALELAAALGERVSRVALLGAAVPMSVSEPLLAAAREDSPAARDMMMLWGHGFAAQIGGNPLAGVHVINSSLRLLERAAPGVLYNDLHACNAYTGGMEAAARVRAPTTLICGAEDKMTPARAAGVLAGALHDASLEVIPRSGHILMTEQPEYTHRALVAAVG